MDRIVKGIWIPIEIWQDTNLSWNEKILLMDIDSFTAQGKSCYISNEYIANLLKVTERSASTYLSNLIKHGYVRVVKFDGRMRYIESTLTYFKAEWKETSRQDGEDFPHTNNNDLNINKEREYKRTRFQKPTIEEIREYCRERMNGIDAEEFWNFYESKGWMVGKSPMKNWKAAITTWEKSHNKERKVAPKERKESVFAQNLKTADQMFGTNLYQQAYGNNPGKHQ